jgi:hypothetical protein
MRDMIRMELIKYTAYNLMKFIYENMNYNFTIVISYEEFCKEFKSSRIEYLRGMRYLVNALYVELSDRMSEWKPDTEKFSLLIHNSLINVVEDELIKKETELNKTGE